MGSTRGLGVTTRAQLLAQVQESGCQHRGLDVRSEGG